MHHFRESKVQGLSSTPDHNVDRNDLLWDFQTSCSMRRWLPSESKEVMRKSRFSDEQVVKIVREADRDPAARVKVVVAGIMQPMPLYQPVPVRSRACS